MKQQQPQQKRSNFSPNLEYETKFGYPSTLVIGVDEVGRGCLAGPVVAAACILPADLSGFKNLTEITDSKLLSAKKREELDLEIRKHAVKFAIAEASVEEIDSLNIHHASHLAMLRAVQKLQMSSAHILVDGKFIPKEWSENATAIIKGDQKSLSIACASILAKVFRDRHLDELETQYPGYGLGKHKGYATAVHTTALKKLGITPLHRKTFEPVKSLHSATQGQKAEPNIEPENCTMPLFNEHKNNRGSV